MINAGIIAGPLYVLVSLAEIAVRDGFDPRRNAWSELANGDGGWIHVANLIVSGLLVVLGAVGWRTALPSRAWAFLSVYGLSMVAAGIFKADPAGSEVSWPGLVHFAAGGVGFTCLVIACFLVARHRLPAFSRITGVVFGASFLALAAGGGQAWTLLTFTAAVILASTWITVISINLRSSK